ncbi:hypothetical protein PVAP13_9NG408700 [Panicum virgatum]|uniref:Uncharacterized protein n=1 Tax=Panicum virgatum TaxID=38727 RepID=A0A8T0MQF1_PANVG|nr:hypothetical protein PVAP13_9NG408700 [Panicum virgatum]
MSFGSIRMGHLSIQMGHLGFVFSFLKSLPCMMMDKLLMCRINMINGKWIITITRWRCYRKTWQLGWNWEEGSKLWFLILIYPVVEKGNWWMINLWHSLCEHESSPITRSIKQCG